MPRSPRCHLEAVSDQAIKAVLGPTNTGKTHLAIERMCGHSSGAIGFPLRLLAREVYDRVRAIKGDDQVALITGEQRIEPKNARYLCCTVEAMPRSLDVSFVALDEAQLGADRERGSHLPSAGRLELLHHLSREFCEESGLTSAELMAMPDDDVPKQPENTIFWNMSLCVAE